jgi:hypothetical protein
LGAEDTSPEAFAVTGGAAKHGESCGGGAFLSLSARERSLSLPVSVRFDERQVRLRGMRTPLLTSLQVRMTSFIRAEDNQYRERRAMA